MSVIEVDRLSKTFRSAVKPQGFAAGLKALVRPSIRVVEAVKAVSFSVDEAEAVAFLGPNGAGKSTTIKMLSGILTPTSGSARVLGLDPSKRGGRDRNALAKSIGAVFGQKSQLWFHLPPADSFRLLGAVYEIGRKELAARTAELVERFDIKDLMDVPVRKLSLGQRIRCEIAASLLHAPRVLFLDEPTIGLDVVVKKEIRVLLEELVKRDRVTIFLTSHDIGDIEKICKRAVIIHHGEVVVDESMKDLKHRALAKKYVGVKYASPVDLELPGLSPVKKTDDAARYEVDTRVHRLPELVAALAARGELVDLTVEDEPLENVIAEIFASRSAGDAHAVTAALGRSGGGEP